MKYIFNIIKLIIAFILGLIGALFLSVIIIIFLPFIIIAGAMIAIGDEKDRIEFKDPPTIDE